MSNAAAGKGFFATIYDGWLLFAEMAGRLNSKIIVTFIYFGLVSFAWLYSVTFLRAKPLLDREFRRPDSSVWIKRQPKVMEISLERMKHQF